MKGKSNGKTGDPDRRKFPITVSTYLTASQSVLLHQAAATVGASLSGYVRAVALQAAERDLVGRVKPK